VHLPHDVRDARAIRRDLRVGDEAEGVQVLRGHRRREFGQRGFIVPYMRKFDARARAGLLVGALAMFLALDVAFLASLIGLPFTPFALGQAIIDVLPGAVSIPLIETLQFWAKGLLVVGVITLFFVGGASAGLAAVSPARRDRVVLILTAAPWLIGTLLGQVFAPLRIAASADHYTVDTTLVKPRVDVSTWKLEIAGNVERPFTLTYDELLDLDAVEQVRTLECISNPVGGELMSTAVWTGVRMKDL